MINKVCEMRDFLDFAVSQSGTQILTVPIMSCMALKSDITSLCHICFSGNKKNINYLIGLF